MSATPGLLALIEQLESLEKHHKENPDLPINEWIAAMITAQPRLIEAVRILDKLAWGEAFAMEESWKILGRGRTQ